MNRALCEGLINPQSCHGFSRRHSPSKRRDCGFFSAYGRKFYCKISDSQKIGHISLSPGSLSLSLPFKPVAALSSSLKFLRFPREDSRKSSQIGFQENGDANRGLEGSGDEEVDSSMDDSQSVDMSSFISLVEEGASGGSRIGMIRSAEHLSRPLVHNFAKLGFFWKKENVNHEASKISEAETAEDLPESCQFIPPSFGRDSCGACCSESGLNDQVTPHSQIARNKEYFERFLHRVTSAERERITQMALLSNLAYRIPTIEEDKLLTDHHFRMISSSFELKASAAPAGDVEDSGTEEVMTGIRESVIGLEGIDTSPQMIDEGTLASLNPAAGYAMAATAASCNTQACDLLLSKSESTTSAIGEDVGGDCQGYTNVPDKCDGDSGVLDKEMGDSNSSSKNPWYLRTASSVLRGARGVSGEQGKQTNTAVAPPGCPCEWFACENEALNTLVIVIQGTETLAAWQANLQFEPTHFEPESNSGVMVHRGIYEAAKRLYDEVFPFIHAHVEAHNENARVQFTGHSLGGSLAVLLSLLVGARNAAPVRALLPVYTFGSPCIMCGGNHLLAQLGLPHSHIRSVVMHMDIVPRAFACDYPDHVAVVLKRVSGTFRNHACLLQQRLIYAPMGEMVIMQPEDDQAPGHPLLPQGSGLYSLRTPSQLGITQAKNENPLRWARELQSAERAFLNVPHPLEILSDRNAYGSEGTISRDHDCRNYLKALRRMQLNAWKQRKERKQRRRARRKFCRQSWAPLLEGGDVSLIHFYREPEKYAFTADKQPLGLEGQYQDLKIADNMKSAAKYFQYFFFFQFKQERSGRSSETDPVELRDPTVTPLWRTEPNQFAVFVRPQSVQMSKIVSDMFSRQMGVVQSVRSSRSRTSWHQTGSLGEMLRFVLACHSHSR